MGLMRFRLHQRDRIPEGGLSRIYVAGIEDIPWSTTTAWQDQLLTVARNVDESGYVYVPWQVDGVGQFLLNTSTLMERDRPYLLDVELARGVIQRLRSRLFVWEWLGLKTPEDLQQKLRDATSTFARAAARQDDVAEAAKQANAALAAAISLSDELVQEYARQALAQRLSGGRDSMLLGVTLDDENPHVRVKRRLVDACNLIQLPVSWRAIENKEGRADWKVTDEQLGWCQTAGLKVAAGPLLQLDDRGAPDWLYLWEGDHENLARLMLDRVRAVVSRYAGRVHLWHVASRVNNGRLLALDEEQRLNLVAQAVQVVRRLDPRTPAVVSFDQPWGEYMADHDEDLAPLHYADALVRADLGVSGFGLEINAGYWPRGTAHRPALEYGRLIDQWTMLGLPLMILLTSADNSEPDPLADHAIRAEVTRASGDRYRDSQQAWAASVARLMLARTPVQILLWNQLSDGAAHEFPRSGLIDADGKEKPTLDLWRDLRKTCL